jgi:hypothetical protein
MRPCRYAKVLYQIDKRNIGLGQMNSISFQVVIFLLSASVVGAVRAAITYETHVPSLWHLPIYCLSGAVALLCCDLLKVQQKSAEGIVVQQIGRKPER